MKKIYLILFSLFLMTLTSYGYTNKSDALSCQDLVGAWHGAFPPYTSVDMNIQALDDKNMYMSMQYKTEHINDRAQANGQCTVKPNGTIVAIFKDHTSVGSVKLTVKLISATTLSLNGKVWIYPPFLGKLTKKS